VHVGLRRADQARPPSHISENYVLERPQLEISQICSIHFKKLTPNIGCSRLNKTHTHIAVFFYFVYIILSSFYGCVCLKGARVWTG